MKIAIIGAGDVGVTTAHALSLFGCEVEVFEQGSSAAQGASFAHSGVLGQSSVQPFFKAEFTKRWIQSWFGLSQTVHWSKWTHINHYRLAVKAAWMTRKRIRLATQAQLSELANYSDQVAHHYQSGDGMVFEQASGLLALHTDANRLERASKHAETLNQHITVAEKKLLVMTAEQARSHEHALATHSHLLGAIYYPEETYGNCALFTKQLKLLHQKKGVYYHFSRHVERLEMVGDRWRVHTRIQAGVSDLDDAIRLRHTEEESATYYDVVIVAAGASSLNVVSSLGLKYPVLSTQAYSVTVPIKEPLDAPTTSVLDVSRGTYITPIGQRIRVSGEHQLGGKALQASRAYKILGRAVQHWFPFASKASQANYDVSHNCVAIDSKPIVGETHLKGLYMNFAHGPHHWALSFGCAHALAEKILNISHAFDLTPFSPQRFNQ